MITKILQDSERPLFFYESLLTSLAVKDVIALPSALRAALVDHLEPIKHGKLHKLGQRIKREISEQSPAPYSSPAAGSESGEA